MTADLRTDARLRDLERDVAAIAKIQCAMLRFLDVPKGPERTQAYVDQQTLRAIAARLAEPHGEALTADFVRAFPGGKMDDSTYEQIESALDRAEAPCQDATGKWLTLPERIAAFATEAAALARLAEPRTSTATDPVEFVPWKYADEPSEDDLREATIAMLMASEGYSKELATKTVNERPGAYRIMVRAVWDCCRARMAAAPPPPAPGVPAAPAPLAQLIRRTFDEWMGSAETVEAWASRLERAIAALFPAPAVPAELRDRDGWQSHEQIIAALRAERDAAVARAEALAAATEAPLSVLDTVGVIIGQAIVCRTLTLSEVEIDRILHVRDELRNALAAYRAASPKLKP